MSWKGGSWAITIWHDLIYNKMKASSWNWKTDKVTKTRQLTKTAVFFLYTNNEWAKKQIKKQSHFTKYLGINLTKVVKELKITTKTMKH